MSLTEKPLNALVSANILASSSLSILEPLPARALHGPELGLDHP
jgi:hypothetical protein